MDAGALLLRLCVVLVVARVAAEVAERVSIPPVLAEIAIGIALGPSALGIIQHDEALTFLAELGSILLLFEVGLHMNLAELRHVGRASMQVAVIGVAVPFGLGYGALAALGVDATVAMFLAAGITATSVGITARVFADLHALATTEARMVLGAAVADDVIGLLILTVAVRIGAGEGVGLGAIGGIAGIAIGFVVAAAAVGTVVAPKLFRSLGHRARTEGTLTAFALAFAIGMGSLASAAKLAPIVGAFVAGVALAGSPVRDDLARRMAPVGHVLIPIFFLMIGAETHLGAFGDPWVLGVGALLTVIGVAGKLVAGFGAKRGTADRMVVGIGMVPRGEVGLIFASLGLAHGILDETTQAVLLVVVLSTTLATPPWLKRRVRAMRSRTIHHATVVEPAGGWLVVTDEDVELVADPPSIMLGRVGLEAALACDGRRPGARLLSWLSAEGTPAPAWDASLREHFFALLRDGGVRSWRFLQLSGLLAKLLPEVDEALSRRARDPFDLDPAAALRWETLEDLKAVLEEKGRIARLWEQLDRRDIVLLAAFARSAFDDEAGARRLASTIGLDEQDADLLAFLVGQRHLLPAAAARIDLGAEDAVLELAAHLQIPQRADALYLLAAATAASTEREALDELHVLIASALVKVGDLDVLDRRRREILLALGGFPEQAVRRHLEDAPRRYLLARSPASVARHLRMLEPRPREHEVRLYAERIGRDRFTLDIVALDHPGALALISGTLSRSSIRVEAASCSTWRTGELIDVFTVTADDATDWDRVRERLEAAFAAENGHSTERIEGFVQIDNEASPWYSIIEVRATDRAGLLHRVASALARSGAQIHHATVKTIEGVAVDEFAVTGPNGHKLDARGELMLRVAFQGLSPQPRRAPLFRRRRPDLPQRPEPENSVVT